MSPETNNPAIESPLSPVITVTPQTRFSHLRSLRDRISALSDQLLELGAEEAILNMEPLLNQTRLTEIANNMENLLGAHDCLLKLYEQVDAQCKLEAQAPLQQVHPPI